MPAALRAVEEVATAEQATRARHRLLYALGNDHAGTYFPVALWVIPELGRMLPEGKLLTQEVVFDALTDLVGSFSPEPGFERCTGPTGQEVELAVALFQAVAELRGPIIASGSRLPPSRARELATQLLELMEELTRNRRAGS